MMNARLLSSLVILLLLAAAVPADAAATRIVVYTVGDPTTGKLRAGLSVTATVSGYCWTGSLAAERSDAWRCMTGNSIYDPCYASKVASGAVYCPDYTNQRRLLAIRLTKPLPLGEANPHPVSTATYPTTIVLTNGATCAFLTGASNVVAGKRNNYGCTDGRQLLGEPNRSAQPWRIDALKNERARTPSLVGIAVAQF
jgi:hypothetical protein